MITHLFKCCSTCGEYIVPKGVFETTVRTMNMFDLFTERIAGGDVVEGVVSFKGGCPNCKPDAVSFSTELIIRTGSDHSQN